jgi:hypothetical protein
MPLVGFEPTIPAFERAKTVHALRRVLTRTLQRATQRLLQPRMMCTFTEPKLEHLLLRSVRSEDMQPCRLKNVVAATVALHVAAF